MKVSKHSLYLLVILCSFISCKKFVDVEPPKNSVTSESVFTSDEGAISAASGLYSQMTSANLSITNGGVTFYTAMAADEILSTNPSDNPFVLNELTADNFRISGSFWVPSYKNIYQANVILENLSHTGITESTRKQLRGEMLVVRALHYFYLVGLFGDVPYITSSDYIANSSAARTSSVSILTSLVSDLLEAQQLLLDDYPLTTKGRPNKWTAAALLARIYLYQNNWSGAESQASMVINSGKYSLNPSLNSVFQPSSSEIIWFLQRNNNNTAEANNFIPSSSTSIPSKYLRSTLLSAFEPSDARKISWLNKNTVAGIDYYYPYKYKQRVSTPVTEFEVVLRLAEMYLIRAEANANQDKITEAKADLNTIRSRAGLSNTTATDKASLLSAIEHERQIELFAEWGHRWFDLKRTGRANAVLGAVKPSTWQSTDQLFPIPFGELKTNPFLTQNPGY